MKQTAFFINIGRGMTTRLDDPVAALQAGGIAGAALDVYEQEPLPHEHPLWTLPNVLLTPHMAGHGPYLDERRFEIMADNCRAFDSRAKYREANEAPPEKLHRQRWGIQFPTAKDERGSPRRKARAATAASASSPARTPPGASASMSSKTART